MAITEVSICNSALGKLGSERISSLSEDSKIARACNERFSHVRDIVLYEHPWNFALVRVALSRRVDTPAFGFTYHFDLPSDCLRIIDTDLGKVPYTIEGRRLLTDASEVNALYIKRVTSAYMFTPSFAEAVALRLGADIAYLITQETAREQSLLAQYAEHLRSCRSFDAQEGTPEELLADEYTDAHIFGELWNGQI